MTGRISIPALRERPLHPDEWVWITPEERLALVEAVEAARVCVTEDFADDTHFDRLHAALARFDFGGHDGRAERSAAPLPVIDFGEET